MQVSSSHKDSRSIAESIHLYLDLIRWNRPAGWLLLLWPSLSALWIASGGFPGWKLLTVFVAGTILMRSAGCCINDVADRRFDRHVLRTAQRPVTSGKVSASEALVVGAVLALLAFFLVLMINAETIIWSVAALAVTMLYPFAKRHFAMPQAVLGVAFGFGVLMAFPAVNGTDEWSLAAAWNAVPALGWWLMLGNLFWVLAYDTEYAMVDRDDDLKIGMKTSAITLGKWDVPAVIAFYLLYLGLWSVLLAGKVNPVLWWAGMVPAGAQVVWHARLIWNRTREGCFLAFRQNHLLGMTVFAVIVISMHGNR